MQHDDATTVDAANAARRAPELDRAFLREFHDERARALPIDSDFYELLADYYASTCAAFDDAHRARLDAMVPDRLRRFVNRECDARYALAAPIFEAAPMPDADRARGRRIYEYRLPPSTSVRALLDFELFYGLLPAFSAPAILLLTTGEAVVNDVVAADVAHTFYHRPQRSRFLFLHEMIVAYLLNLSVNPGTRRARCALRAEETEYELLATYVVERIAACARLDVDEVIGLHFADSARVERTLPRNVRDLLTFASHVYWYVEHFMKSPFAEARQPHRTGPDSATRVLTTVISFVLVPSLHRLEEEPSSRLRADAGRVADATLYRHVTTPRRTPASGEIDLFVDLAGLTARIWEP